MKIRAILWWCQQSGRWAQESWMEWLLGRLSMCKMSTFGPLSRVWESWPLPRTWCREGGLLSTCWQWCRDSRWCRVCIDVLFNRQWMSQFDKAPVPVIVESRQLKGLFFLFTNTLLHITDNPFQTHHAANWPSDWHSNRNHDLTSNNIQSQSCHCFWY